jgi:hypothetical protein
VSEYIYPGQTTEVDVIEYCNGNAKLLKNNLSQEYYSYETPNILAEEMYLRS